MCERLKQAVLKTALPERVTGVRIPLPPPNKCPNFNLLLAFFSRVPKSCPILLEALTLLCDDPLRSDVDLFHQIIDTDLAGRRPLRVMLANDLG